MEGRGYTAAAMAGPAPDFGRDVQTALTVLYDSVALQTHPLVRHVQAARGRALSPSSTGRTLRQELLETIASLRPAARTGRRPAETGRAGRTHRLLELRYVEGLDPEAVQHQLGISKSLYYLEHKRALTALTAALAERWRVAGTATSALAGDAVPDGLSPRPAPRSLTSFVGRTRELLQIARMLGLDEQNRNDDSEAGADVAQVRLITLLGPAGAGKTRLAAEAAARAAERGRRVCFVELAALEDAALVLPAIASALGLRGGAEPTALREALAKTHLLVLDNFEQVIGAASSLESLLEESNSPRVLVTSRAPLRLHGEWELPVEPLPLPASETAVAANDAVRLFVERARAVRPDFALTPKNAPVIAEIVQKLDGLPLAIELAAARTRVLPPQELLARLDKRLTVLASGPRDRPSRQRTLEGALDWSYRLLEEEERGAFRRLAVFAAGASLEAAGEVAGATLELIESLVSKSLLRQQAEPDGAARLSMLQTVREYAWNRLCDTGTAEDVQRRHASYFLSEVEAAEHHLVGPKQGRWLAKLEREYGNLRAAVRWYTEQGLAEEGLRLASALRQFWLSHGRWAEGRQWLTDLLALAPNARTAVHAKALDRAGALAATQGDPLLSRGFYERALELWRELREDAGAGRSLTGVANALVASGEWPEGQGLYRESITLLRAAADEQGLANALGQLGIGHYLEGEYDEAELLLGESLALRTAVGDRSGILHSMNMLGSVARCKGQYERADSYYRDCLDLCDELGHRLATATVLYNLGQMANAKGESVGAAAHFLVESLSLFAELEDRRGIGICAESVAIATAGELPETSIRLFAAAERLLEQTRMRRPPADRALAEVAQAAARERLGGERAGAVWAAGTGLRLDGVVRMAHEAAASLAATSQHIGFPRNDQSQYAANTD